MNMPDWFLEHTGEYFLVTVSPNGEADLDGGHSDIEGVVKAKKLIQGIFKRPNERYYAIQVVEIPDIDIAVNDEAMGLMNKLVNNRLLEEE